MTPEDIAAEDVAMRQTPETAADNAGSVDGVTGDSKRRFLGWMVKGGAFAVLASVLPACLRGQDDEEIDDAVNKASATLSPENAKIAEEAGAVLPEDDPETRDAYFYGVSVMMGLGIAVDVAVATLAMYRKLGTTKAKSAWIFGVGASHILLPVFSGAATAGAEAGGGKIGYGEMAQRGLSAAGFAILAKFLYGEIKGGDDEEDVDVIGSLDASVLKYLAAVWSVSVDAAISGPAKWEQARTANWGRTNIMTSIVIGGLTVALVAALALKGAEMLHKKYGNQGSDDVDGKLKKWDDPLLFVEALALNYFGMNALVNGTFKMDLSPVAIAGLDAAFTAVMFTKAKGNRAEGNQKTEAPVASSIATVASPSVDEE